MNSTTVGVDHAAILIFQDRDLQPLRIDVGAHAAEDAADVEPVRHAAGEGHELALVEDRQRERDMVEMAAGEIGVVGDVDVGGADVGGAEMRNLCLHRLRHAADEHRQADADRDGLALRGEQAGGEIERLVDDDVVGGAHEVGLHFLGHRDHAIAHDLGHHGIDRPAAAMAAVAPARGVAAPACGLRPGLSCHALLHRGPGLRQRANARWLHPGYRPPAILISRLP